MNKSRILTIKNAKFSGYYFHMNLNIYGNFQNFINVTVTLNVPCVSESCVEVKMKLNFYFALLCGASKGL